MKYMAVSVAALAVAATSTSVVQSAVQSNTSSVGVNVSTTFNAVSLTATSAKATTAVLQLGTDSNYGLLIPDGKKKSHRFNVASLRPATKYFYRAMLLNARGKVASSSSGSFTTSVVGPAAVRGGNGQFLLNGAPTFILAARAYSVCPDQGVVDEDSQLGLQVMLRDSAYPCSQTSDPDTWASQLHAALAKSGQMWWLEYQPNNVPSPGPSDFPELLKWEASKANKPAPTLAISCDSQGLGEPSLFDTVKREAEHGPVLYWTFLHKTITPSQKNCLTGPTLSRLFWTVVAAQGGGLEFVTQDGPTAANGGNGPVSVNEDVAAQAKKESLELAALQPALLAPTVSATASGPLRISAHRYKGVTYALVVNSGKSTFRGVIRISSTRATVATVYHEGRSVRVKRDVITDTLLSTDHRIYILH